MEKRWSRKKRAGQAAGETRRAPVLDRVRPAEPEEPVGLPIEIVLEEAPQRPTPVEIVPEPAPIPEPAPVSEPVREPVAAPEPDPVLAPDPISTQPSDNVEAPTAPAPVVTESEDAPPPPDLWPMLKTFTVDRVHLERNRIITAARHDPAHTAFDVLRTKLLRALRDNGWTRVAITSPTEGCGKTFMATNLALSLSRQANCRTVLLDLDMRRPSVAKVLGIDAPASMGDFLRGEEPVEQFLRKAAPNDLKIGDNIAVGANGRREDYASELLQLPETAETLNGLEASVQPDVILFDMPPALVNDDVLAARPLFDGVLLIVGGGITKPNQIRDVERRLGTETPLLGVVLNRSEGEQAKTYSY